MDKIRVTFNIFVRDNFEDTVREYYEMEKDEEVTDEDIREFIQENIEEARSIDSSFEVEGGDTDGWFIQSIERE